MQTTQGNTLLGFITGLILGLLIAVAVLLYINQGANPFTASSISRHGERAADNLKTNTPTATQELPDPNVLFAKNGKSGKPLAPDTPNHVSEASAGDSSANKSDNHKQQLENGATIFVQAGAFSSAQEADNQRAKLAFAGFETQVFTAEVSGKPMYRVRLGPFAREDEANQQRIKLLEVGVESTIIR